MSHRIVSSMLRPGLAVVVATVLSVALSAQQPQSPSAATPQPQAPAQQPPAFKSGTQVVQVDVRVFDTDGHFVTDLKPEDFEIKEDGTPQAVVNLALVGANPNPSPSPASESAAPSTEHPAPGTEHPAPRTEHPAPRTEHPAPRTEHQAPSTEHQAPSTPSTWIFVFDTMHLSPGGLDRTQKAVEQFLSTKFHDGDIGGIVADGKMANNRMTSVREELVKAVRDVKVPTTAFQYQNTMHREWPRIQDEFEAWRIAVQNDNSALQQAIIRACSDDPDRCKQVPPDMQVQEKSRNIVEQARASTALSLKVIDGLSNGLARMAGPKTVVYLSEGFVLQDMEQALRDATGMANRAGAHFYTIDARGLNKGSASSSIIDEPTAFDSAGPSNRVDMQEDGTNALAVDTGGMAIRNENNFGRALDVIQRDAATYYVLGYTPSNPTFDGKYRKIDVTVKRPGVKVRARRGYLALEPAMLLRPKPITTASTTAASTPDDRRPTSAGPTGSASEPAATASPSPASETRSPSESSGAAEPAATALKSAIESHGLVQELQGAERLSPSKASDLAGKGWSAYQKGDVEHAAVYLGQAAQSPDAHPWVHYALGLSHLALGHYSEAVASWEQVRKSVPEFEPVYFNLADGYMLQKDNDTALKVLRDAQARWPKDSEVWNATGVVEVRRGAIDAAIKSFTQAVAVAPTDSLGYFNLAKAYQVRAAQSQRFDSTTQKWVGGEGDNKKATEYYTKYVQMGGPFVQQAKEALQVLNWKSNP